MQNRAIIHIDNYLLLVLLEDLMSCTRVMPLSDGCCLMVVHVVVVKGKIEADSRSWMYRFVGGVVLVPDVQGRRSG